MTIRPLYDRIVVKRTEEKQQMQGGLHIPDSAKEKPQEAVVTAVGKGKRLEDGTIAPLDVKVGDRVLLGKYAGNEIKVDGQDLLIIREEEVLGIVQTPAKLAKAS
jgi:chaperonin GroES